MKKKDEEALDLFLDNEEENAESKKDGKAVVIKEREGLIERVDKILITKDGKQLLREQY